MLPQLLAVTFASDPNLEALCVQTAKATVEQFVSKGLAANELAMTVGVLDRDRSTIRVGSYRGGESIFPASVVKAFYLVYVADALQSGNLKRTDELERATRDMIVDSSNDATGLIMDMISGTTGGPELEPEAFREWQDKRNVVNRYFADRGYKGINVNQKTWGDGPYGRERQSYGPNFENRNKLTTDACVRLFGHLALDRALAPVSGVTPEARNWNSWALSFLTRKNPTDFADADGQAREYIGKALPAGAKLRSKAGWTSTTRHDAVWVTLPDGRELLIAIFTTGRENAVNKDIIPFVAARLLEAR